MEFGSVGQGVRVTVPDRAALNAALRRKFAAGEGFALATLNLDHVVKLRRDPDFARAYAAHDLVTADGNPVVWLCRLAGEPVQLLPGSDLTLPLCRLAAESDVAVALFGATEESLAGAAATLESRVPGLRVAWRGAPPMGVDPEGPEAEAALDAIAASGARFVLIALGAPKQERFAALGRARHPALGFASVGAALDFLSGAQKRAPAWVRAIAMEWVWRLLSHPGRLAGRYARSAAVMPGLAWVALRQRYSRRAG